MSYGFDSMEIIPNEGQSGGMAMIWKSSCIKVHLIDTNRQFFHEECELPDRTYFLLTSVYVVPHLNLRSKLKVMSASILLPWIVLGDFNDIMAASERIGGVRCNTHSLKWFSDRRKNLPTFHFFRLLKIDGDVLVILSVMNATSRASIEVDQSVRYGSYQLRLQPPLHERDTAARADRLDPS
ncbi:hypothetical protein K1719_022097 [Acacia pycnantha]|nr:hypothetical protein K1719_022097 [Acacia pycnantha]